MSWHRNIPRMHEHHSMPWNVQLRIVPRSLRHDSVSHPDMNQQPVTAASPILHPRFEQLAMHRNRKHLTLKVYQYLKWAVRWLWLPTSHSAPLLLYTTSWTMRRHWICRTYYGNALQKSMRRSWPLLFQPRPSCYNSGLVGRLTGCGPVSEPLSANCYLGKALRWVKRNLISPKGSGVASILRNGGWGVFQRFLSEDHEARLKHT